MFPSRRFSFLAALVLAACGGAPPAPTAQISTTPASNAPAQPAPAATPTWSDADSPVPVTSDNPSWGRRDAPVTIVLFSDFQCPFCARVEPTFDQIRRTYGPEKVRIVWKNQPLPFHANALPAATAAQTVFMLKGAEAFWKFHDAAFTHQRELSDDSYVRWAADAGIDPASFKAALASHKSEPKIVEDMAIARKVGANGTPMSFVNGVEISGAQPFDAFKKIIDLELAKAELKIASGTAKGFGSTSRPRR